MKKPENVLETKDYIEPNNFESDQEAILFYSYVEQENYIKYLEQQLLIDVVVGQSEQLVCNHSKHPFFRILHKTRKCDNCGEVYEEN